MFLVDIKVVFIVSCCNGTTRRDQTNAHPASVVINDGMFPISPLPL